VNKDTSKKLVSMLHSRSLKPFAKLSASFCGVVHRPGLMDTLCHSQRISWPVPKIKKKKKKRRKNSVTKVEEEGKIEKEPILMTTWTSLYQDATDWRNIEVLVDRIIKSLSKCYFKIRGFIRNGKSTLKF